VFRGHEIFKPETPKAEAEARGWATPTDGSAMFVFRVEVDFRGFVSIDIYVPLES